MYGMAYVQIYKMSQKDRRRLELTYFWTLPSSQVLDSNTRGGYKPKLCSNATHTLTLPSECKILNRGYFLLAKK